MSSSTALTKNIHGPKMNPKKIHSFQRIIFFGKSEVEKEAIVKIGENMYSRFGDQLQEPILTRYHNWSADEHER